MNMQASKSTLKMIKTPEHFNEENEKKNEKMELTEIKFIIF